MHQLPLFCDQFLLRTLDDTNVSYVLHRCSKTPNRHRLILIAAKHYLIDAGHFVAVEKTRRFRALFDNDAEFRAMVLKAVKSGGDESRRIAIEELLVSAV